MKNTNFALFCLLFGIIMLLSSCGGGGGGGGGAPAPTASVTVHSPFGEPDPSVDVPHYYALNSPVTVSCGPTPYPLGATGTRYECTGWALGAGDIPPNGTETSYGPFAITQNSAITWTWQTQYYLTIEPPDIGDPQGAGWYDAGDTATWRVTSPVSGAAGIEYVAYPATGTVLMDSPQTVTPWTTRYRLITEATPSDGGSVTPSGETWYDAGTVVSVTAIVNAGYWLANWSGDMSGSQNPENLTMDAPKTVTANFAAQFADFSGSPRSSAGWTDTDPDLPLTVRFTDESGGIITSWEWDFNNDGDVDSTEQNPSHIYDTAGRYTVTLTVSGLGTSNSQAKTDYIRVCDNANAVYVKTGGDNANDGSNWAQAKKTIQAGINAATTDWSVRVAKGTYNGAGNINLDFAGKAIHLKGVAGGMGNDVGADWIIDGGNTSGNRGFIFQTGEIAHSVVDNFTIKQCRAPSGEDGGGIFCYLASPTIINCRMDANMGTNGGAICCDTASDATITDCTFRSNQATGSDSGGGGGIYCFSSSPRITNCFMGAYLMGNIATNNGGGIYCEGSNMRITICTMEYNSADGGGGIYCSGSSPLIYDCVIKDNIASDVGGGIYLMTGSNATITDCDIYGNSAANYGGGIYSDSSAPTISNCTIGSASAGNTAGDLGGGICLYSSSPDIINCIMFLNEATNVGGAIECWNQSNPAIINCVIAYNKTTSEDPGLLSGEGGGIMCEDSSPTLTNCTIANNSAAHDGGGIYCFVSSPVLNNSILWDNDAASSGHQIYTWTSGAPCDVTLNYSDYADNTIDPNNIAGSGTVTASACKVSDPLFVDAENGDYHLQTSPTISPCIDAGNNLLVPDGVTTDLDGNARIAGGLVDMGAYEYQLPLGP